MYDSESTHITASIYPSETLRWWLWGRPQIWSSDPSNHLGTGLWKGDEVFNKI